MLFRMIQPLSLQSIKDSVVTRRFTIYFPTGYTNESAEELMNKYGNNITLMDGIYRTTKYGFPCIFLTVKTSIGSGMVVATIIPQYENEDLLVEGITILKQWNALWSPKFTMTDKSAVELGAIGQVFPSATRLLCDFHRSQAWERWVSKNANDINPQDRSDVLEQLKKLAYAPTSMLFCKDFNSRVSYRGRGALVFLPSSLGIQNSTIASVNVNCL